MTNPKAGATPPKKPGRSPVVVNHEEQKAERPPESAESFEHVIRRAVRERERLRDGR